MSMNKGTPYWFPWQMRLSHGLELLADALVYAGALALLLGKGRAGIVSQIHEPSIVEG